MSKRDLGILALALLAALGGTLWFFRGQALPTASWGLSFSREGEAPRGSEAGETLARYGAAYLGDTEEKVLYLTFDAGYENGFTGKILDVLRKHRVPTAFFLVGNYLQKNPDLVRRMAAEGHTVGNHTMHHPDMSALADPGAFARELQGLEELYREITGEALPKFYRPPQGLYSAENLETARELGYHTVFWSLAYADWDNAAQPSPEEAFRKLLPRTHNGAVVLLHATSKTNAEILDALLTRWKEMGYRFATLEELFSP